MLGLLPSDAASGDGAVTETAAGSDAGPQETADTENGDDVRVCWFDDEDADVSAPGAADTTVAGRFDGTSAAAPVVAGAVATIQADEALSPAKVEAILRATADGDARAIDGEAALTAAGNVSPGEPTTATDATNATAADRSLGTDWRTGSIS